MISDERLLGLFTEHVGDIADVVLTDRQSYIASARGHVFVQMHVEYGLYDQATLADDFVSFARAEPTSRDGSRRPRVVLCGDVARQVLDGIDDGIAEEYLRYMAMHERGHVEAARTPRTAVEHLQMEAESHSHDLLDLDARSAVIIEFVERHSRPLVKLNERIRAAKAARAAELWPDEAG